MVTGGAGVRRPNTACWRTRRRLPVREEIKMSENRTNNEIKEYAEGWISERKGTDVPVFLKFAYLVIVGGAVIYFIRFMFGEVDHETRGNLVRAFNEATQSSTGLMYAIVGMIIIYALILAIFAFRKVDEDEN
jgi:SNF family Na+-dependent transporter